MIIVSLSHFIRHFQPKFKDALLENQHKKLIKKFTSIFSKLKQQGVQLIFPYSYNNETDKRLKRKFEAYKDGVEVIDQIEKDNNLESLRKFYGKQKNNELKALRDPGLRDTLKEVAADYGELEPYLTPEHHSSVFYRKLAKDLNAFAILACDSNYIIAEGSWKYWASNELDFENLTVEEYDKQAVLDHLGLSFQQVPQFQAMGGVLMSEEDFKIIRGVFGFRPTYFFKNLARHIKKCNFSNSTTFTDLQKFKQFVQNKRGENLSAHFVGDLQKAFKSITISVSLKILKILIGILHVFFRFQENLENRCDSIGNYKKYNQGFGLKILTNSLIRPPYYFVDLRFASRHFLLTNLSI